MPCEIAADLKFAARPACMRVRVPPPALPINHLQGQLREDPIPSQAHVAELERDLATVTAEIGRLTDAIASGADLSAVIVALKARDARRTAIEGQLRTFTARAAQNDAQAFRDALRERLADWRSLLSRQVPQARQIVKKLLAGTITFTPERQGVRQLHALRSRLLR